MRVRRISFLRRTLSRELVCSRSVKHYPVLVFVHSPAWQCVCVKHMCVGFCMNNWLPHKTLDERPSQAKCIKNERTMQGLNSFLNNEELFACCLTIVLDFARSRVQHTNTFTIIYTTMCGHTFHFNAHSFTI